MAYRDGGGCEELLDGVMKNLRLLAAERKGIHVERKKKDSKRTKDLQAVRKLFSDKPGFTEGINQTLGKIWSPGKGIRCRDLGENIFLLTFPSVSGKRRALEDGPWAFNNELFVVTDFYWGKPRGDFFHLNSDMD